MSDRDCPGSGGAAINILDYGAQLRGECPQCGASPIVIRHNGLYPHKDRRKEPERAIRRAYETSKYALRTMTAVQDQRPSSIPVNAEIQRLSKLLDRALFALNQHHKFSPEGVCDDCGVRISRPTSASG